jgi:hypothetical protein
MKRQPIELGLKVNQMIKLTPVRIRDLERSPF